MKKLTDEQIAWIAGIYEGEGSCDIRGKSAVTLTISMTDHDIIKRIHEMLGVGCFQENLTYSQKINVNYKLISKISISGKDAIALIRMIRPLMCKRRGEKLDEALIHREKRVSMLKGDTHCRKGHEMTIENTKITKRKQWIGRSCRTCANEASKRYKERKAK